MIACALTAFSFCSLTARVLFSPSHRHLGDVLSHGTSSGMRFVTDSCVNERCQSSVQDNQKFELGNAGHHPVDEIMTYTFSLGWNTGMAQKFVNWAIAFLLSLAHFYFRTVLGCSLPGLAVIVVLRFVLFGCLSLPLGWGALVGLRHQVLVRRHVYLRGPTHVHSSSVFWIRSGCFSWDIVVLPEVPHRGHHELGKGPWSPKGGRGRWPWRCWPGCMLHQMFSLLLSLYSSGPWSCRPQPLGSGGDATPCEDTRQEYGPQFI